MKQQTFPSDIIWQKSTCLTASLNSLTITSTMQEVSEGWGQPEKSLFCHAARWLFWMKEASQAYCPYSEMLSWHLDVSIMIILTQLSTLHLRFGGPSEAEDDQHRCCMSSRYTTESPFSGVHGSVSALPDHATCLSYTAAPSCSWGDIALGLDLTQSQGHGQDP